MAFDFFIKTFIMITSTVPNWRNVLTDPNAVRNFKSFSGHSTERVKKRNRVSACHCLGRCVERSNPRASQLGCSAPHQLPSSPRRPELRPGRRTAPPPPPYSGLQCTTCRKSTYSVAETELKETVSRDWIGPFIVFMDRPYLVHMSRR
jgi:hypothetical protein